MIITNLETNHFLLYFYDLLYLLLGMDFMKAILSKVKFWKVQMYIKTKLVHHERNMTFFLIAPSVFSKVCLILIHRWFNAETFWNDPPWMCMLYTEEHFWRNVFRYQNVNKGNNKITELRTIFQRESQNS